MSNINQIWLAPICHEDGDGRLWCQDDVWGDDCGCGIAQHSAVRYVLASDYDRDMQALRDDYNEACADAMQVAGKLQAVEAERDALRAQVEAMLAAPANERAAAFEACPESNCDWGAFYRGWMARAALQAKP